MKWRRRRNSNDEMKHSNKKFACLTQHSGTVAVFYCINFFLFWTSVLVLRDIYNLFILISCCKCITTPRRPTVRKWRGKNEIKLIFMNHPYDWQELLCVYLSFCWFVVFFFHFSEASELAKCAKNSAKVGIETWTHRRKWWNPWLLRYDDGQK